MIANSHLEKSNTWSRIKKILKKKGIKGKEKFLLKEKIGFRLIDNNKYNILTKNINFIDQ